MSVKPASALSPKRDAEFMYRFELGRGSNISYLFVVYLKISAVTGAMYLPMTG
jgi:hypothetical protein